MRAVRQQNQPSNGRMLRRPFTLPGGQSSRRLELPAPAPGPYYAKQVSVSVILDRCVPDSEEEEKEKEEKKDLLHTIKTSRDVSWGE